jgi:hypothetical protein
LDVFIEVFIIIIIKKNISTVNLPDFSVKKYLYLNPDSAKSGPYLAKPGSGFR